MWIGENNGQICLPEGEMSNFSMTKYDFVETKGAWMGVNRIEKPEFIELRWYFTYRITNKHNFFIEYRIRDPPHPAPR